MNTAKIYHDSDGNECTIFQAVRREPSWAATRIQIGEQAIKENKQLKEKIKALEKELDGWRNDCTV